MSDKNIPEHSKQGSVFQACELVRQFITIATGGIAFTVGLSVASSVSACFFWTVLFVLGLSVVCGLLFLMHTISNISYGDYNINAMSVRLLAMSQIVLVAIGVLLLCFSFSPG